jgi:hypothetical protein
MWARKVITAALAAGAMALAAPAGIAIGDPTWGPNGPYGPVINDYVNKINALADQYTANGPSGSGKMSQQQFADQLRAANDQLRQALVTAVPPGIPGQ